MRAAGKKTLQNDAGLQDRPFDSTQIIGLAAKLEGSETLQICDESLEFWSV